MENKKTISSAKAEKEYDADAEQGKASRSETTRDFKMEEINEKTRLLGDASTGARPKTLAIESRVKIGGKSSASPSPDSSDNAEVALNAAASVRKAIFSCRCVINIANLALCDGEKRLETVLNHAEKVHHSHVTHYLAIASKYRTINDLVSESVLAAEKVKEKAEIAAENAEKAGKNLSELTEISNSKDAEFWATWATTTAKETKIDVYKAAYAVLIAIKKFWQGVDDSMNLEASFEKVIQRPSGELETSTILMIMLFILGCIVLVINHNLEIENHTYYLMFFIGFLLIMISVLMGIVKIVGYCTNEENFPKKIVRRNLKDTEDRLRAYDDYFAKNKITPVPSSSSEDEVPDEVANSHAPEEIPLKEK